MKKTYVLLIALLFALGLYSCSSTHKVQKARTETTIVKYDKHGKILTKVTTTKF